MGKDNKIKDFEKEIKKIVDTINIDDFYDGYALLRKFKDKIIQDIFKDIDFLIGYKTLKFRQSRLEEIKKKWGIK